MGLLNTTTHNHITEQVTKNVNIKEYRAPTDESINIYKELEEKARQNIIRIDRLDFNEFIISSCIIKDELRHVLRVVLDFKINGKLWTIEVEMDEITAFADKDYKYGRFSDKFYTKCYEAVANKIASIITLPLLNDTRISKF